MRGILVRGKELQVDVKEIREALDSVQIYLDYEESSLPEARKTLTEVRRALSTIDPDAIRRECAEKAIRHIHDLGTVYSGDAHYIAVDPYHFEDGLMTAILSAEPAQGKCLLCANWDTTRSKCAESNVMSTPDGSWYSCNEHSHFEPAQDGGKAEANHEN